MAAAAVVEAAATEAGGATLSAAAALLNGGMLIIGVIGARAPALREGPFSREAVDGPEHESIDSWRSDVVDGAALVHESKESLNMEAVDALELSQELPLMSDMVDTLVSGNGGAHGVAAGDFTPKPNRESIESSMLSSTRPVWQNGSVFRGAGTRPGEAATDDAAVGRASAAAAGGNEMETGGGTGDETSSSDIGSMSVAAPPESFVTESGDGSAADVGDETEWTLSVSVRSEWTLEPRFFNMSDIFDMHGNCAAKGAVPTRICGRHGMAASERSDWRHPLLPVATCANGIGNGGSGIAGSGDKVAAAAVGDGVSGARTAPPTGGGDAVGVEAGRTTETA